MASSVTVRPSALTIWVEAIWWAQLKGMNSRLSFPAGPVTPTISAVSSVEPLTNAFCSAALAPGAGTAAPWPR
jgi:hypothetical protein